MRKFIILLITSFVYLQLPAQIKKRGNEQDDKFSHSTFLR